MDKFFSFSTNDIKKLEKSLKEKYRVFSPQKNEKNYLEWVNGETNINYYGNTVMPVKNYFFPQFEKLFAFKAQKGKIKILEIEDDNKPTVFFGVRQCDLQSIDLLDKVFLTHKFTDKKYKQKREKSVFIGFSCLEPYETCFCTSIGYNLIDNKVSAILFFKIDHDEYLALVSEKGEQLLTTAGLKKPEASQEQLDKLDEKNKIFKDKFKIKFELGQGLGEVKDFFNDKFFEKVSFKCIGCGICTYVCPTCHCFTIADNAKKQDGYRMRCWDYCMNPDFTLMAGGHNPRGEKHARIRQRFLHKGFYFEEKHDVLGCVGCGRCLAKCPVSMDICDGLKHVRGTNVGRIACK